MIPRPFVLLVLCSFLLGKLHALEKKVHVEFDHLYLVLEDELFEKIRTSTFLKNDFSFTDYKTVSSTKESWTAFFLIGKNNYIEIFKKSHMPKSMDPNKLGGIIFRVSRFKGPNTDRNCTITLGSFRKNLSMTVRTL